VPALRGQPEARCGGARLLLDLDNPDSPFCVQGARKPVSLNPGRKLRISAAVGMHQAVPLNTGHMILCIMALRRVERVPEFAIRRSPIGRSSGRLTTDYCNRLKVTQTARERTTFFVKVLITGGAGYIGGTVATLLAQNGHNPVIFDNLSHGRRELLPAGVDFVEGDIADRSAIEAIFASPYKSNQPFDAVLHFAAFIEAGESMVYPERFFRNNTAGTLSLLEAMVAAGPRRIVFSSTAAVYGEPETTPIPEDAPLRPTNAYGFRNALRHSRPHSPGFAER
jgi:hypothetical protein